MRVIWAFIWSFVLTHMVSYVVGSMLGSTYNFQEASIYSVAVTVLVLLVGAAIPNEPVEQH
ncbi:YjzD family protein [Bacillus manliponensis]|uniref:DeoR faimly transcriptional regulator n=1 Tax=Bacillus manliponensis TaxID=574376 RepID=A0A073KD07_9BACI|nr:YjzD family protein [Bacillus manliponensis]KEK20203.1 DeoR faimly transcriptional regulator [Bacillus manliponensis]